MEERSVVDGFVGLPAELLGGLAVDEYIIYKMEWLFAMPLMQLIINQLVNLWVWFAHVQKVRSKAMLKHGHVVAGEDVVPMQIVVVAQ